VLYLISHVVIAVIIHRQLMSQFMIFFLQQSNLDFLALRGGFRDNSSPTRVIQLLFLPPKLLS
jgi:hypothetical protein